MADTIQPAVTEKAPTVETKAQAVSIEQLEATMKELNLTKQALEDIKKAQAGSDGKVSALLAELQQKDKVKQTAEERIAALEKENAEAKRMADRERWLNAAYKKANEKGLPTELIDNYGGDPAKLDDFLAAMKKRDDDIAATIANKLMTSGLKPGSGSAPVGVDYSKMSQQERMKHAMAEAEKRLASGS